MEKEIKSIKTAIAVIIIYLFINGIFEWMDSYNDKVEFDKIKRIEQRVDSILNNKPKI